MKVLSISNQYAPVVGGIEVLLSAELLPALVRLGHEVEVLTSTHQRAREPFEVRAGIPVHRVGLHTALARADAMGTARARHEVRRIVERFRPDVVHVHDPGPIAWSWLEEAARRGGPPSVLTLHVDVGSLHPEGDRGPVRRMLRAAGWVTGVSGDVVADAVALEPSVAERSTVVRNAVAVPDTAPLTTPAGPPLVLAIGRLTMQKGFDVALRAFAVVRARRPDARLVIAGDGRERHELERLLGSLGLDDAAELVGLVRHPEVAGWLARASVVVIPSRYEGLPLVGLEASAAARAIVATPVQGLGEVILDGRTGLLVAPEDVEGLAAAVLRLLDDRDLADRLGRAAHEHVAARFGIEACAAAYVEVYEGLRSR